MKNKLVPTSKNTSLVPASTVISYQNISDDKLIELWLHNKSPATQECYRSMIKQFLQFVKKLLKEVGLSDIHAFLIELTKRGYKPLSIADYTTPIKSLLKFGYQLGALPINIGALVKKPKVKNELAERILLPEEVTRMILFETNPRNKLILKVAYAGGLRASELCRLKWRDVQSVADGAVQLTVFGKGNKTRFVKLPPQLSSELLNFKGKAKLDDPVFRSKYKKNGGHFRRQTLGDIVKAAAQRAGIEGNVSPHWLRHSHASHALQLGAPIQLVRETLGHSSIKITERYLHVQPGESSSNYLRM